ncbi:MAG: restriction endonuclease subunit S [Chloroflexi bacterium]|nr:restriction endonuclease subunit S [Chloroflexota bacterium]
MHPSICNSKYFRAIWDSQFLRFQIETSAHTTAGIYKINQQHLRSFILPLPPLAEQQRIVAEVERRLSVVEEVEVALTANLHRAGRLRQSILKQAFEGRLVAQDSADEPASVLLARIRAERAAVEEKKKRGRQLELPGG